MFSSPERNAFNYLARKYDGDRYVKQFTCYNQLAVLMFGQLSNRESLRDVVLATQAHAKKAFHLGFGKHASRSTLADANTKRDYRIFEEFAYKVVTGARACRADDIFNLGGNVYAFDSTTIELSLKTFTWALYRKNNDFRPAKWTRRFQPESGILSDAIGYSFVQAQSAAAMAIVVKIFFLISLSLLIVIPS